MLFHDLAQFLERLRNAEFGRLIEYGTHSETRINATLFWQDWCGVALCILDELGTRGNVTDHAYSALKRAIDDRCNRPLVLISNASIGDLARMYDDRIASRIAGGTVVTFEGDDLRLKRGGGAT